MTKEKIASSLFYLTNNLKDKQRRKGWYQKSINRNRVESVADHIYGCQMLAYAMYSEFNYDIDIKKVILMLSLHEIGETVIGDITPDDMPSQEKTKLEHKAVTELLSMIPNGEFIKNIYFEFEERKTKEAIFAYQIDKAECDLQAKLYTQEGCFRHKYSDEEFIDSWIGYDRERIEFDNNFDSLLDYIINNEMNVLKHQNDSIKNVVSFYELTNNLKDRKRKGEEIWNINKENYGSIAEHIYSVQMLAIIIYLVYEEDIDIEKVISLITTHELGEIINGDIDALRKTDIDRDNEFKAAKEVASILSEYNNIINQVEEFNDSETKEAIYSKYCDKLAPDIISKIYDKFNFIDLNNQQDNPLLNNTIVKKYLETKNNFSTMWILYGQEVYNYPEPFINISNHILNNDIEEKYTEILKEKGIDIKV